MKRRSKSVSTVLVPKTKKAVRNICRGTSKRVRFFMKSVKTRVKKAPSYIDRALSRTLRMISRRR